MHNLLQVGVNNVVLPTVNNVVNIEQSCVAPSEQCWQQEKQCYNIVQPSILLQLVNKVEQQW